MKETSFFLTQRKRERERKRGKPNKPTNKKVFTKFHPLVLSFHFFLLLVDILNREGEKKKKEKRLFALA